MEAAWLIDQGIITEANYRFLTQTGQMKVVRRGCKNTPALVAYQTIPQRFKGQIKHILGGDPFQLVQKDPVSRKVQIDYKAYEFYNNYTYPDGSPIPTNKVDNITNWSNAASILNLLRFELERHTNARAAHGRRPMVTQFYKNAVELIKDPAVKREFPNDLPENPRRLKDKLDNYRKHGYESLVKHYKGNKNAKKVTSQLEKLILALYALPNKPYMKTVHEMYQEFLQGQTSIIDEGTGEIFSPEDFYKNDKPIEISESTINNYINRPSNRVVIDRLRNDAKHFNDTHAPHHHRLQPSFSLSKVSMDDRDLPNSDVKAYYVYDIASGCIIGKSYSEEKNTALIINCLRDMFWFLDKNNLGMPLEVEVEHHLMNRLTDTVMKEGSLFKYIRWCNPGNSQEKWAETGNRLKKYGVEKKYQEGIGRFYSKLEANRPKQVGEWDENGMRIKERKRNLGKAVADDLYSIEKYNHEPHPKHPGKTRMDVLLENTHPECIKINTSVVARQIGHVTRTTVTRSQYVTVKYEKYALPSINVLQMLQPNNYTVEAYYLEATDGEIGSVYLYQNDVFICTCKKIQKYNTARAERTDADADAYTQQAKYVSKFRKAVKNGKDSLPKLTIIENDDIIPPEEQEVEIYTAPDQPENDTHDTHDTENFNNNPLEDF